MLKVFCLIQSVSIVLTLLSANVALSQSSILNSLTSDTRNCDLRRPDGTVVHLDMPCGQASPTPVVIDIDQDNGVDITSPEYQEAMEALNKQRQIQSAEASLFGASDRKNARQKRY